MLNAHFHFRCNVDDCRLNAKIHTVPTKALVAMDTGTSGVITPTPIVVVQALRSISPGEEILCNYGRATVTRLGLV